MPPAVPKLFTDQVQLGEQAAMGKKRLDALLGRQSLSLSD
jgi:hypothetical protein